MGNTASTNSSSRSSRACAYMIARKTLRFSVGLLSRTREWKDQWYSEDCRESLGKQMEGKIMGLDQYAYAIMPHKDNTDFDWVWGGDTVADNVPEPVVTIAQWRKHPNLHGWMEQLFVQKADEQGYAGHAGGFGEARVFNCQPIRLTWQDLVDLENAVLGDELPETAGFFFGESLPEDREDDLAFIKAAREAIKQDMEVYYDSWW